MHKSYLPLPSPKKVGKSAYGKAYRALRKLVPVDENRRQAKQLHRREHGAADSPTPTPNKYYNWLFNPSCGGMTPRHHATY